jgi:putative protease
VVTAGAGSATLALDIALDSDDTIEFWTSKGRFAQRVGPMELEGRPVSNAPAKSRVTIATEDVLGAGDRAFRVRNAALSAAAERLYADEAGPAIPLSIGVRMVLGEPLGVVVTDSRGRTGSAEGEIVEAARTKAVTADDITEHVGRLGGTPYRPDSWDIALSPGVGASFSALHAVRRAAVADYEREILSGWRTRKRVGAEVPPVDGRRGVPPPLRVVAVVSDGATARACIAAGADEVHLPASEYALGSGSREGLVPVLGRICHAEECDQMLADALPASDAIAGTLGGLVRLASEGVRPQAHWSLNAANAQAVALLSELGADSVWLSPELTLVQVRTIARSASVPVGVAIGGRQELMVTEHCVLMTEGPCSRRCADCVRRRQTRYLRDRKGYEFPVISDVSGRTHVFNAVPLDVLGALPDLIDAGITAVRLDLETESSAEAAAHVARVVSAVRSVQAGLPVEAPKTASTTSGHFYRGVS